MRNKKSFLKSIYLRFLKDTFFILGLFIMEIVPISLGKLYEESENICSETSVNTNKGSGPLK